MVFYIQNVKGQLHCDLKNVLANVQCSSGIATWLLHESLQSKKLVV